MTEWMKNQRQRLIVFGVLMLTFLSGATAVALSCIDSNREVITYEVSALRVNGEPADTEEYGSSFTARGGYDDGVDLEIGTDEWSASLTFEQPEVAQ